MQGGRVPGLRSGLAFCLFLDAIERGEVETNPLRLMGSITANVTKRSLSGRAALQQIALARLLAGGCFRCSRRGRGRADS